MSGTPREIGSHCVYLTPDKITKEMIIDFDQILGRVLQHDKPPGYVFTEKDFLEKGTRARPGGRHSRRQTRDDIGRQQD